MNSCSCFCNIYKKRDIGLLAILNNQNRTKRKEKQHRFFPTSSKEVNKQIRRGIKLVSSAWAIPLSKVPPTSRPHAEKCDKQISDDETSIRHLRSHILFCDFPPLALSATDRHAAVGGLWLGGVFMYPSWWPGD